MNPIIDVDIRDFAKKSEAQNYLKHLGAKHYVLKQNPDTWLLYTTNESVEKNCYPLASAVSAFFEKVDHDSVFVWAGYVNDRLALVAVKNNIPYSSQFLNKSDLGASIQQLNNRLQIESMQVFADDRLRHEFADEMNFADEVIHCSQFERYVSSDCVFQRYHSNTRAIFLASVFFVAIGGVVFDRFGGNWFKKPEIKVAAPAAIQRDYAAEYEKAIGEQLAAAATPKLGLITEIDRYFKSTEIGQDGWVINEISCSIVQCVETFLNKNGTQTGMKKDVDNARFPELEKSESTTPINVKNERLDRSRLPTLTDFSRDLVTSVQQIQTITKVQIRIDPPAVIGASKDLPINQVPADRHVKRGSFELTGPIGALDLTLERLPDNTGVESLKLSGLQTSDIKFSLTGAYYVK